MVTQGLHAATIVQENNIKWLCLLKQWKLYSTAECGRQATIVYLEYDWLEEGTLCLSTRHWYKCFTTEQNYSSTKWKLQLQVCKITIHCRHGILH